MHGGVTVVAAVVVTAVLSSWQAQVKANRVTYKIPVAKKTSMYAHCQLKKYNRPKPMKIFPIIPNICIRNTQATCSSKSPCCRYEI
jgi:hypothetical protein